MQCQQLFNKVITDWNKNKQQKIIEVQYLYFETQLVPVHVRTSVNPTFASALSEKQKEISQVESELKLKSEDHQRRALS